MLYPWEWIIALASVCDEESNILLCHLPWKKEIWKTADLLGSIQCLSAVNSCNQSSLLFAPLQEYNSLYKPRNKEPHEKQPPAVPIPLSTVWLCSITVQQAWFLPFTAVILQTTSYCSSRGWCYCISAAPFCQALLEIYQGSTAVTGNLLKG